MDLHESDDRLVVHMKNLNGEAVEFDATLSQARTDEPSSNEAHSYRLPA